MFTIIFDNIIRKYLNIVCEYIKIKPPFDNIFWLVHHFFRNWRITQSTSCAFTTCSWRVGLCRGNRPCLFFVIFLFRKVVTFIFLEHNGIFFAVYVYLNVYFAPLNVLIHRKCTIISCPTHRNTIWFSLLVFKFDNSGEGNSLFWSEKNLHFYLTFANIQSIAFWKAAIYFNIPQLF